MAVAHEHEKTPRQIGEALAEIHPKLTPDEAVAEAQRCLYCYDAPCTRACPTHIDVPAFIKKIATGNLRGSARVILESNLMGATCARVCPVEVLCEGACVEKTLVKAPIQIGRLQRYATDHVFERGIDVFTAGKPNGRRVAVIGSGPGGLSCAGELAKMGYAVTVFDDREHGGGLDTYGMAEYKMTKDVSLAEVKMIRRLGVEIRQKTRVGRDVALADLERDHDAVFIGVGLGETARLRIPGEELPGVWDALSWIELIKIGPYEKVPVGRHVAVIGAGNTAIDAVTQSKRLGAERSFLVYRRGPEEMPAYDYEYELARLDGCGFEWFTLPVRIEGDPQRGVERLVCRRTRPTAPDAAGRPSVEEIPGSEFTLDCDMVIKATGQTKRSEFLKSLPGVQLDDRGRVTVDPATMQTSNPKYFAGGDCVNGGAEAVNAVQDGKLAARGIDAWLHRTEARHGG